MVVIYFRSGEKAEVGKAVSATIDLLPISEAMTEGRSEPGLLCRDAKGELVAAFVWAQVAGYAVEGKRRKDGS